MAAAAYCVCAASVFLLSGSDFGDPGFISRRAFFFSPGLEKGERGERGEEAAGLAERQRLRPNSVFGFYRCFHSIDFVTMVVFLDIGTRF